MQDHFHKSELERGKAGWEGTLWGTLKRLQVLPAVCYTRDMRNWMRERMKRRKKKQENVTEATGKVGQQKSPWDELHPGPIVPSYSDPEQEGSEEQDEPDQVAAPQGEGSRVETEIQPESPELPRSC